MVNKFESPPPRRGIGLKTIYETRSSPDLKGHVFSFTQGKDLANTYGHYSDYSAFFVSKNSRRRVVSEQSKKKKRKAFTV